MSRIPAAELNLAICNTCGTQFDVLLTTPPPSCHICDDPRQYVPPSGQSWTSLATIQRIPHTNTIEPMPGTDGRVHIIHTEPRFAIGQRAFLIRTSHGNVLWDLVTLLDDDTVAKIDALGGISAIVISHPHFYTTHLTWSRTFANAPVYLSAADKSWLARPDNNSAPLRRLIESPTQDVLGTTAICTGGHFPGSMVLLWERRLFVADSAMITPAALYDGPRPPGTVSFSFLWSYPNLIPLPPAAVSHILSTLTPYDFDTAHGGFMGSDIARDAKRKLVESAKLVIGAMRGVMPGEEGESVFWM